MLHVTVQFCSTRQCSCANHASKVISFFVVLHVLTSSIFSLQNCATVIAGELNTFRRIVSLKKIYCVGFMFKLLQADSAIKIFALHMNFSMIPPTRISLELWGASVTLVRFQFAVYLVSVGSHVIYIMKFLFTLRTGKVSRFDVFSLMVSCQSNIVGKCLIALVAW